MVWKMKDEKWWWQSANYLKLLRLVNIKLIRPEPPWVMLHHNLHNFSNTDNPNLEIFKKMLAFFSIIFYLA